MSESVHPFEPRRERGVGLQQEPVPRDGRQQPRHPLLGPGEYAGVHGQVRALAHQGPGVALVGEGVHDETGLPPADHLQNVLLRADAMDVRHPLVFPADVQLVRERGLLDIVRRPGALGVQADLPHSCRGILFQDGPQPLGDLRRPFGCCPRMDAVEPDRSGTVDRPYPVPIGGPRRAAERHPHAVQVRIAACRHLLREMDVRIHHHASVSPVHITRWPSGALSVSRRSPMPTYFYKTRNCRTRGLT